MRIIRACFGSAVQGGDALPALARDTEAALAPLGIAKEDRAFTAHLTLARIKEPVPLQALRNAIEQLESVEFGNFRPTAFICSAASPARPDPFTPSCRSIRFQARMMPLLALVVAYLVGGIPFGYLLVRLKTGEDVRSKGSGNIGATNVLRTTGRAVAVATLLLDIAKGFFAVWLAARLTDDSVGWMSLAALAVMAGHAYPVFLKFHGGKAVASFIGAFCI